MAAVSFDVERTGIVEQTGITVSLPSVMQSATGGRREVEVCSGTVGQALSGLVETFPDLLPVLLTEQEQIHRFVNVYLGDEDIRFLQGLNTPVLPGQRLIILSAIAGVTADTTNCPETAMKLPGGGHENCPLTAMRSARHDSVCLAASRG